MVTDHGKANTELAALAARKGIQLPQSLMAKHATVRDRFASLSGAEFDRAYMQEMVRDHNEDIAAFQREAQSGTDPDIKAWAARTLPMVRDHLALARQVNSEVVLGPAAVPAAIPAAVVIPWCEGAYAPGAGTNFGSCKAK
jgi:putative membrane protein